MTKITTLEDLFDEEESILARRSRERREREAAHALTPEGIAEHEARLARWAEQEALRADEPDPVEEDEEEEDEEEDDREFD